MVKGNVAMKIRSGIEEQSRCAPIVNTNSGLDGIWNKIFIDLVLCCGWQLTITNMESGVLVTYIAKIFKGILQFGFYYLDCIR